MRMRNAITPYRGGLPGKGKGKKPYLLAMFRPADCGDICPPFSSTGSFFGPSLTRSLARSLTHPLTHIYSPACDGHKLYLDGTARSTPSSRSRRPESSATRRVRPWLSPVPPRYGRTHAPVPPACTEIVRHYPPSPSSSLASLDREAQRPPTPPPPALQTGCGQRSIVSDLPLTYPRPRNSSACCGAPGGVEMVDG